MTTSCWVARSSEAIGAPGIDVEAEIRERVPGDCSRRADVDHAPARRLVVEA